ncbi:hypothetical protein PGT21_010128 [Puccinia graminis f. sp. tritici]|uniref:Uncharacterized protein n=1 Tax=Puccinia graminis f. sp. tritici TaxID=56615 RepID=A0A5B0N5T2_PUCGR|nr:hypothetical protein PGT21_010128 [Puccinia graminis f. sp. tritici]
MASQTPKSTQNDPSGGKNTESYSTDHSQTQRHHSSRASSLVIAPKMVAPSSDSRVRLTRPAPHKRPAEAERSSNSESANLRWAGRGVIPTMLPAAVRQGA